MIPLIFTLTRKQWFGIIAASIAGAAVVWIIIILANAVGEVSW